MLNLVLVLVINRSITTITIKSSNIIHSSKGNCTNHINNTKDISSDSRDILHINSNNSSRDIIHINSNNSSRDIILINNSLELIISIEIFINRIKKNLITNQVNTITTTIRDKSTKKLQTIYKNTIKNMD